MQLIFVETNSFPDTTQNQSEKADPNRSRLSLCKPASCMVVNGPLLHEEENLRIWNRAGFKRGVQQTSVSHAAVSPRSL